MMHNTHILRLNDPREFKTYYSTACCVCLKIKDIKRCSLCKIMPYCCEDHQKLDWKQHKRLCRIIADSMTKIKLKTNCNNKEWCEYRFSLKLAWEATLKRSLRLHEDFMWMFLRSCNICHSMNDLKECPNCFMVSYCSEEHKNLDKDHLLYCDILKLSYYVDCHLLDGKSLPYFRIKEIAANKELPITLYELLQGIDADITPNKAVETIKYYTVDTVGTILFALRCCGFMPAKSNQLVIHIVGPAHAESHKDWGNITEIIFHFVPKYSEIAYYFIGPEVIISKFSSKHFEACFCENCIKESRHFHMFHYEKYYHEIIDEIPKPDLVFAFNCGLSENQFDKINTWSSSIDCLLKYDKTPLILTSYTLHEAIDDFAQLGLVKNLKNVEYLVKHEKNRYASPKPFRDWSTDGIPVYYSDNYISILRKP